ncbi:hypothetical protein BUALT_Bualt05G0071600 [Buddleja alternifolia]|uniref:Cytochrome P450 n=1 Tax=Buddleja alternifolia TaxID=168488 RepID=A0AAV6XQR1_9LAMI|nr:hypothetical protein BUALT_Bualt05G0071600 [Buddleja alternifolia]
MNAIPSVPIEFERDVLSINLDKCSINVSTLSFSILVISIISLIWYIKTLLKPAGRNPPLPPGPRGLPILGYLPFLGNDLLQQFTDLGHKYGPIYKFRLGNKLCVVISSPSLVKEVLRDKDAIFANRDITVAAFVATYGGNDIAWSKPNSQWRLLRKIFVREMLSHKNLEASYNLRKDEVRKAIKYVHSMVGKPVEIGELSFRTELNVIINMLWGGTLEGDESERLGAEFRTTITKLVDLLGKPNISDFYPVLAGLDIEGVRKEMEIHVQTVDKILDTVISKHKKKLSGEIKNEGKKDFLQILLELNESQDSEMSITQKQLRAVLMPASETPPLPPGPRGLPILGYLPFLGNDLLKQFTDLGHKYGPIYKLRLGNKLCVVISSPSLVKEVVRDKDAIFANRDVPVAASIVTYGGNDIAWSKPNSGWRLLRKIFVREMLSNTNLEASYNLRKDEVRKAIKYVHSMVGKPIEIGELSFRTELNVIINMLWGGTLEGDGSERLGAEFRTTITKLVDLLGKPNISDFYPVLAGLDIEGVRKEMEIHVQTVDKILDTVISKHKKKLSGEIKNEGKKDFLQILLELNESQDSEMSITQKQLRAILSRMLMHLVGSLVHSFEWKLSEGETLDMSQRFGIVLRKNTPLLAIPSLRISDSDLYA